jgi:hypothetical protein
LESFCQRDKKCLHLELKSVPLCICFNVFVSWDRKVSLSMYIFFEIPRVSRKHSRLKLKVKGQGQLFVNDSFILPYRRRLEGRYCSKVEQN